MNTDTLKQKYAHDPEADYIADIAAAIPDEAIAGLPTDGASEHDHYLYGSPKREQAARAASGEVKP